MCSCGNLVYFNSRDFFGHLDAILNAFSRNNTCMQKRGLRRKIALKWTKLIGDQCRRRVHASVVGTLLKLRLRRHLSMSRTTRWRRRHSPELCLRRHLPPRFHASISHKCIRFARLSVAPVQLSCTSRSCWGVLRIHATKPTSGTPFK